MNPEEVVLTPEEEAAKLAAAEAAAEVSPEVEAPVEEVASAEEAAA